MSTADLALRRLVARSGGFNICSFEGKVFHDPGPKRSDGGSVRRLAKDGEVLEGGEIPRIILFSDPAH